MLIRCHKLGVRVMSTLETLAFDNSVLRELPLDTSTDNFPRQVKNACFSKVQPTKLASPETVVYSAKAMDLLDLPECELQREEFPSYFCGTSPIPGAEYAAHCYCGHQFGHFSGQLGDGATMYVGEVVNTKQERWEIQFKGAGKTPFSRSADGRKVLRSSLREMLCSEAMFHLGVPTTRAGSCVVSRDTVVRDILYDGHPIHEKCTVILRIAPSFLRFGSFEIFKPIDRITSRVGPSVGKTDILMTMLEYTLKYLYPHITEGNKEDQIVQLYREIMHRTAALVAKWQAVGFCHGVLNTDNMSILGLTIDYGPFGFMETYDPGYICNGSDNGGRYTYQQQPEMCKWNVEKLGEMLALVVNKERLDVVLQSWDSLYEQEYLRNMRGKLGLISEEREDDKLISSLLETMHHTHSDFTNTFLVLQEIECSDENRDEIVDRLLNNCLDLARIKNTLKTTFSKADCQALLQIIRQHNTGQEEGEMRNPLAMYGIELGTVIRDSEVHHRLEQLAQLTDETKREQNKTTWINWLDKYKARVARDVSSYHGDQPNYLSTRKELMERCNPVVVPRNHVLQRAVEQAELGDYTLTRRLLKIFEEPYTRPQSWMCERDPEKGPCTVT